MIIDNIYNIDISSVEKMFPTVFNNKKIKEDLVDNPFSRYLFFVLNEEVVAFLNYTLIYERIEIININVLESHLREGIATRLMDKLINIAKDNNCLNITLEVRVDNYKAIKLYEKYLFNKVAYRKGYYNGIDALLMERSM